MNWALLPLPVCWCPLRLSFYTLFNFGFSSWFSFFLSLFCAPPTRIPYHRWLVELTLFFRLSVLARQRPFNTRICPGQLLWYFLGALSLMILFFLLFWHASVSFSSAGWLLFFLSCLSAALLILSRMLDPQDSAVSAKGIWAARLFQKPPTSCFYIRVFFGLGSLQACAACARF
jgi:hypothetical protein